ncbi:MAG: hypothetical protein PHU07_02275 [Acidocella sp.]|nr:hypothetical protein [Acidocella sp.]
MSTVKVEIFNAFRAIGVPEDKALKAASALNERARDVTTSLMTSMGTMKWMLGLVLAFQVAIFVKMLVS